MKTIKLLGISAVLMGILFVASGCSCGGSSCQNLTVDCASPCTTPIVKSCSPCGR